MRMRCMRMRLLTYVQIMCAIAVRAALCGRGPLDAWLQMSSVTVTDMIAFRQTVYDWQAAGRFLHRWVREVSIG